MWRSLVAVAGLVACGKHAHAPDCEHAGDGVRAFWTKQLADEKSDAERAYATTMVDVAPARLVRHCKADGWSAEAIACAKIDAERCLALLTPAQQQALRDDPEAQALTKQQPLELPAASAEPTATCELDPIEITVTNQGVWIGAKGSVPCLRWRVNGALDKGALVTELRRLRQQAAGCAVPIELSAVGTVPYEDLTTVMDLAMLSGLSDVRLASPDAHVIAKRPAADCPLPGGRHDLAAHARLAKGSGDLKQAPVVVITADAITFQGKTVAPLTDVREGGATLTALERALPAHPSEGTIIVQADKDISSVVVLLVVETLQRAGYDNVLFAVQQK